MASANLSPAALLWSEFRRQRRRLIEPAKFVPHPKQWPGTGLFAAWLGHSTVLIKIDGITILTDPILGDRCGFGWAGVTVGFKRYVAPALRHVSDFPRIDVILLSHAHFDHFDRPTLRKFENRGTTVVTSVRTSDLLRPSRYRAVHELAWGERILHGGVSIRAFPVKHWGARMRRDTFRGYNGYVVETAQHRVVFGGDTAYTETFKPLKSAGPVNLAILPIGAYDPWIAAHCNPEQAMRMGNDCGAEFLLPVHHRTFQLSREPFDEPIERFLAAAGSATYRVALTEIGQEWGMT